MLNCKLRRRTIAAGHGWSAALCEQTLNSPSEPQIRTPSRQYFRDAMLLWNTPMPEPALYSRPNSAGSFSVTARNCCVVSVQALQESAREWHGNDKPPQRSSAWSPRPATRPLRAWPKPASPILASLILSGNSPDKLHAISSNRRRPGCQVTASPTEEAPA